MQASKSAEASTRRWIEDVVVGLNLCPFAKPVLKGISIEIFQGDNLETLTHTLGQFIADFAATPEDVLPTAVFVTPDALEDFLDYNDYLEVADGLIRSLDLEGVIQIASFHPTYRFAGSDEEDPSNYSNRSPYPMFHLLREEHVSDAVARFPDTEQIPTRNVQLLRMMGIEQVRRLRDECTRTETPEDKGA